MGKISIIFIMLLALSGCASTRVIESARNTIDGLEQLNREQESRNSELAGLLESEREGNQELKRINENQQSEINSYTESERNRIESEKLIIDRLSGIFSSESEIIEKLIEGYNEIRKYFEYLEVLE